VPTIWETFFICTYLHIFQLTRSNRRESNDIAFVKLDEEDTLLVHITNLVHMYVTCSCTICMRISHFFCIKFRRLYIIFSTALLLALELTF